MRLVFEHLQTGGVRPFAIFRTVRLLPYDGDSGELQLALDGLIITAVLLLLLYRLRAFRVAMVNAPRHSPAGHLTRTWVWVDWVFIFLFWVVLASKYYVRAAMEDLQSRQGATGAFNRDEHLPLHGVAVAAQVKDNTLAVASLFVYFKVFKCAETHTLHVRHCSLPADAKSATPPKGAAR